MNEELGSTVEGTTRNDRVVARRKDGTLIKGTLEWQVPLGNGAALPHLPETLHIQDELSRGSSTVCLADVKAIFFVRTHEGNFEYDEVKFLPKAKPSDLWIQVRLVDGESLEGRIENNISLLVEPGFWLRPADGLANNMLIYVPKTSATEFHVIGLASCDSP